MSEIVQADQGGIVHTGSFVPTREQIQRLERELAQMPQVTDSLPLRHHFAPGVYMRELTIPAGVMLTGKTHKTAHMNIISAGDITVWTEEGMKRIRAPYTFMSLPGTKRVGYAHADTVWTTVHVNADDKTDPAEIEAEVIDHASEQVLDLPGAQPALTGGDA